MAGKSTLPTWKTRAVGKSFFFAGKHYNANQYQSLATQAGGSLAKGVQAKLDYLVLLVPRGTKSLEKEAEKLNKNGAAIQVIDVSDFLALFAPTRDEALVMLTGKSDGLEYWASLSGAGVPMPDLSGSVFHGMKFALKESWMSGVIFGNVKVDGADFSGADLPHGHFRELQQVNLQGANLAHGSVSRMADCNVKNADFSHVHINPAQFERCDFSDAKLHNLSGYYSQISHCNFTRADLTEARLDESKFTDTDFAGANFHAAHLGKCDFTAGKLAGANLSGADLTEAKLNQADLTGADLTGACLLNADLTDAVIDGANFEGANIFGAKLQGLNAAKAKGLDPSQPTAKGQIGPNIRELENQAKQANSITFTALLGLTEGNVQLQISASKWGTNSYYTVQKGASSSGLPGLYNKPIGDMMIYFGNRFSDGQLRLDSITVKAVKASLGNKELKHLVLAAWCEAFAVEIPREQDLKDKQKTEKIDQAGLREKYVGKLRSGPAGVKRWNALKDEERKKVGRLRRVDLSGVDLTGVNFQHMDLERANLAASELAGAQFYGARLGEACFKDANLAKAYLAGVKALDTDFSGCNLTNCNLRAATFRRAKFQGAKLNGSEFLYSDLCGADFTSADLGSPDEIAKNFEHVKFDDQTRFPKGFTHAKTMQWKGKGPDPRLPKVKIKKSTGPIDLATFMKSVEANTDAAKLSKALRMLKTDRFKLYAQVEKDVLAGVVKSQTDAELVYSCRLASDGVYGCCTQNLNICGGLRGSLCKHLLVLIVGLANSNELDLAEVESWIAASRAQKPMLDKDASSETFLRYKGAEAGEVDWRPTETIPEDYYAL